MAGSYSARSALMAPLHWPTLPPPRTERAAVLDTYFNDLKTQMVQQGTGWRQISDLPRLFPEL